MQILTLFESALKRDFISSTFSTTEELLGLSTTSECPMDPELVSVVPWVPRTTAAVSLRLLEFDASVMYVQQPEPRGEKEVYAVSLSFFLVFIRLILLLNLYNVWYSMIVCYVKFSFV